MKKERCKCSDCGKPNSKSFFRGVRLCKDCFDRWKWKYNREEYFKKNGKKMKEYMKD